MPAIRRMSPSTIWCAIGDGLIVLTGGAAGPMGRLILDGQVDAAREWLRHAKEAFGDRLYVELMRHGLDDERATEAAVHRIRL